MGDLAPPPMATARSKDKLPLQTSEQTTASLRDSNEVVTSPQQGPAKQVQSRLGHGSAMFSTDLGRRAPRKLQSPSYTAAIARSNMVSDVVSAAGLWRSKYPYQYLCIFPHADWKISDLWDEEDIHLETPIFCKHVLQFIERDNGVRAQKYAQDWSERHPERLPIIGGDIHEWYDKSNPLSIVDKNFVNKESREYPPIFLWHVAHIMRTAMLAVKEMTLPVKQVVGAPEDLLNSREYPVGSSSFEDSATSGSTLVMPTPPSTTMNVPTQIMDAAAPTSYSQPVFVHHRNQKPSPTQSHTLKATADIQLGTTEHGAQEPPRYHMSNPEIVNPALRVPKTRQGRSASGTYNETTLHVENMPRGPSGRGPLQHSGPMSTMHQSPRYNQAHMIFTQPMGNVHPGAVPATYEHSAIPFGVITGQPQSHGIMQPSMIAPHAIRGSSMTHGYPRMPSGPPSVPYAAPMGDVTNMPHALVIPQQHFGAPHINAIGFDHRYMNANALYDPYEGSNPAFRATGYPNGSSKKRNQSGIHHSNGRQRKASFPGSRPHHGQYANDRSGLPQMSGRRPTGPKPHLENDVAITQDRNYGCDVDWIGPQNETVNELYIKDLPEDIEPAELEAMFHERLGVNTTSINIKSSQFAPGRKHAFVGFSSTSIAKKGIMTRDATIRGLPVSITVPRRFFQKTVEVSTRDVIGIGPSPYTRFTANPNNGDYRKRNTSLKNGDDGMVPTDDVNESMSYSPQDARSDMHKKKKKGKQSQQPSATQGSPEARKTKPKKTQGSPVQKSYAESTGAASDGAVQQDNKTDVSLATSNAVTGVTVQKQQSHNHEVIPSGKEVTPPAVSEERYTLNASPSFVDVPDVIDHISGATSTQHQHAAAEQVDSQRQYSNDSGVEGQADPGSTEHILVDHASAGQGLTPMAPLDPEATLPEDRMKNEPRYHSAAESQAGSNMELEPVMSLGIANQGNTSAISKAVGNEDDCPSSSHVLNDQAATVAVTMPPAEGIQAAPSETYTSATMPATMVPSDCRPAADATAAQEDTTSVPAAPAIVENVDKSGAQHTESLHPFSKAAKALAKKEKEQKKKAQKKEKEQADKAKAARAAASKNAVKALSKNEDTTKTNGSSGNASVGTEATSAAHDEAAGKKTGLPAENASSMSNKDDVTTNASLQKSTSDVMRSDGAVNDRNKPGKRKGMKTSAPTTRDTETAEEDEDHGKQPGGIISVPNELSSVTNKEVQFNLPEDAPASDVQCCRPEHADEVLRTAKESVPTVKFAEDTAPAAKKKKSKAKKKRKKAPKWPNLEFRPKSPNPPWMGPIDMATDVQHYDEIMKRACGGEDDSDFSWSDLPLVEDEMSYDEEELDEGDRGEDGGDDKGDLDPIKKRIEELQVQQGSAHHSTLSRQTTSAAASSSEPSHGAAKDAATFKTGQTSSTSREDVVDPAVSTLETQINATNDEINTSNESIAADGQVAPSNMIPVAKKKKKNKPNNRKNKKRKAAEKAETTETAAGSTAETGERVESTSNMTVEELIDSNDPFYDQLKEIEDTKRGNQGTSSLRGGSVEAAKTCDEPHLMRTMEAYFKETQGSGPSTGKRVSQKVSNN